MSYDSRPDTRAHIATVHKYVTRAAKSLLQRGLVHDASKLESPEVDAFDVYTPKLAEMEYGSEEYEACRAAMGTALEHHYAANSHHPEHYEDGISGMSLLDLLEMICDWKAASERMRPSAPSSPGRPSAPKYSADFLAGIALNQERFGYSDELRAILENTARELGFVADEAGSSAG